MRLSFTVFCFAISLSCSASKLEVCTDNNYWYPYTYTEQSNSEVVKGMHIDILKKVLAAQNMEANIKALPWKRCLAYLAAGKVDILLSASYTEERGQFAFYPPNVEQPQAAQQWRIAQGQYVVVTHNEKPVSSAITINTLPEPVRSILGYSITNILKSNNVKVTEFSRMFDALNNLYAHKSGSLVLGAITAQQLSEQQRFAELLTVHPVPIRINDYFVIFSKASKKLAADQRMNIWKHIRKLRDDKQYQQLLLSKYFPPNIEKIAEQPCAD